MYLQRLSFADGSYKCFISFCAACPVTATPRVEGEALKATVCACVEIIFENIQHHLWIYLIHHLHVHTHVDTSEYICANPHYQTWVYFQIRSIYVHATTYFTLTDKYMGVSLNGGTPISHPKMIIFGRKLPWLLGISPPFKETPIYVYIYNDTYAKTIIQNTTTTTSEATKKYASKNSPNKKNHPKSPANLWNLRHGQLLDLGFACSLLGAQKLAGCDFFSTNGKLGHITDFLGGWMGLELGGDVWVWSLAWVPSWGGEGWNHGTPKGHHGLDETNYQ